MIGLQEKVAIVTGASRGIGKAIALRLAKEGAHVVVTATTQAGAEKTAREIEALGRKSLALAVDVSKPADAERLVEEALKVFSRVDILVNNAGIRRDNLIARLGDEDWEAVIDVNLKGAFNCIKAVTRPMMKQRRGKIINITSASAFLGTPGQANYCAAKAGIVGLTKSAAHELASRNITVNAVAPGFILTDMTAGLPEATKESYLKAIPLGRQGTPEDVAGVVAFLCSYDADYITGQVLHVNGGLNT